MRFILFLFVAPIALAACGSGGGGTTTTQTAALQGMVYEVDGQTLDRSGVDVRVLETGQAVTTGPDGWFFFTDVPADAFTLDFGGGLVALAQKAPGDDDDADEDDDGNPQVAGVQGGDTVEVLVAVENAKVTKLSVSSRDRVRADAKLELATDSPDADVEGKVRIESRSDREKFSVEAENLDPGTEVEFFLDDGTGFTSIGTATADAEGEAELEFNTKDGDTLPLGAATAGDLSGFAVEVRLATGEVLLTGEVPELPDGTVTPGHPGKGSSTGKARLTALVEGLKGEVEIEQDSDEGEQEFSIEAQKLEPGTAVAFWIEDPTSPGSFVRLAGATADAKGKAEYEAEDGALPLGVTDVTDLVGLAVQVTLDDGSDQVLLEGTVPPLGR